MALMTREHRVEVARILITGFIALLFWRERWRRIFRQPDRWTLCFVATGLVPEKAEAP